MNPVTENDAIIRRAEEALRLGTLVQSMDDPAQQEALAQLAQTHYGVLPTDALNQDVVSEISTRCLGHLQSNGQALADQVIGLYDAQKLIVLHRGHLHMMLIAQRAALDPKATDDLRSTDRMISLVLQGKADNTAEADRIRQWVEFIAQENTFMQIDTAGYTALMDAIDQSQASLPVPTDQDALEQFGRQAVERYVAAQQGVAGALLQRVEYELGLAAIVLAQPEAFTIPMDMASYVTSQKHAFGDRINRSNDCLAKAQQAMLATAAAYQGSGMNPTAYKNVN